MHCSTLCALKAGWEASGEEAKITPGYIFSIKNFVITRIKNMPTIEFQVIQVDKTKHIGYAAATPQGSTACNSNTPDGRAYIGRHTNGSSNSQFFCMTPPDFFTSNLTASKPFEVPSTG
jgi:hypothetical protein